MRAGSLLKILYKMMVVQYKLKQLRKQNVLSHSTGRISGVELGKGFDVLQGFVVDADIM